MSRIYINWLKMLRELKRPLERAETYLEIVNEIISYYQIKIFFVNKQDKADWIIKNSEKMQDEFEITYYGRDCPIPGKELKSYLKCDYIHQPFKTFPKVLKFYQKFPDSEDPPRIAHYLKEELLKFIQDLNERIEDIHNFDFFPDANHELHYKIKEVSLELFRIKHYAEAVFASAKALNNYVKDKAGITNKDLSDAMAKAFNEKNPIIKLNDLKSLSDIDEQRGFKFLFMGAMIGIRNPMGHELYELDRNTALEYLTFLSLLFRKAEEGEVKNIS